MLCAWLANDGSVAWLFDQGGWLHRVDVRASTRRSWLLFDRDGGELSAQMAGDDRLRLWLCWGEYNSAESVARVFELTEQGATRQTGRCSQSRPRMFSRRRGAGIGRERAISSSSAHTTVAASTARSSKSRTTSSSQERSKRRRSRWRCPTKSGCSTRRPPAFDACDHRSFSSGARAPKASGAGGDNCTAQGSARGISALIRLDHGSPFSAGIVRRSSRFRSERQSICSGSTRSPRSR